MTKEEFKAEMDEIERKYKKERNKVMSTYAFEHAVAKEGDTVRHVNNDRIIVDTVKWIERTISNELPSCVYIGPRVTTKGIPYKNGERLSIWEASIKRVNGLPV